MRCSLLKTLIFCVFLSLAKQNETMSDAPKRHSTRQRRPPKFRQMDTEFGLYSEGRPAEQKEFITTVQETNQLAKLLVRFIASSNQKLRDIKREDNTQLPPGTTHTQAPQHSRYSFNKTHESRNQTGYSELQSSLLKHHRDGERGSGQTLKAGSKSNPKKGDPGKKGSMGLPPSIESDLSYHTMLGKHIRSNLPDSKNLSPEMLMQLQLPSKELLEQNKGKDSDKKKKGSGLNDLKRPTEREELKPFKRQSYHVAIAYHIFLKQIKAGPNPSPRDIDPTYNARRLRDQSQKPQ